MKKQYQKTALEIFFIKEDVVRCSSEKNDKAVMLRYEEEDGLAGIKGWISVPQELEIPSASEKKDLPVYAILNAAFFKCKKIVDLKIPWGMDSIDPLAFANCMNLERVTVGFNKTPMGKVGLSKNFDSNVRKIESKILGDGMTNIRNSAFSSCIKLKEVFLKDGVVMIGDRAFSYCDSLEKVDFSGDLFMIGKDAFYGTKVKEIVWPMHLMIVGENAFPSCLEKIYYYGTEQEWKKNQIATTNKAIQNAKKYFYRSQEPKEKGKYWHYIENKAVIWE